MFGQKLIRGKCLKCGKGLPHLIDDGTWGTVDCTCGEWYDVPRYKQAGGVLIG